MSQRLHELGAHLIAADDVVRFVQQKGRPTLAAIQDRFGSGVVTVDGELDRPALARIVFGDAAARRDLEAIVHPAVQAESRRRVAEYESVDPNAIIIYDIPLLVESGRSDEFDAVIVIACPPEIRMDRLIRLRGMTEAEALSRIDSQATEEERKAVADWIIDSSNSVESTLAQADEIWADLVNAYRA